MEFLGLSEVGLPVLMGGVIDRVIARGRSNNRRCQVSRDLEVAPRTWQPMKCIVGEDSVSQCLDVPKVDVGLNLYSLSGSAFNR